MIMEVGIALVIFGLSVLGLYAGAEILDSGHLPEAIAVALVAAGGFSIAIATIVAVIRDRRK